MIKTEISCSSKDDKLISSLKTIRFLGIIIYQKKVYSPGLGEYELQLVEISRKKTAIMNDEFCEAMLNALQKNEITPS